MALRRKEDGRLNVGDMASFSLGLMFKRLDVAYFFIPAFLVGALPYLMSAFMGVPEFGSGPESIALFQRPDLLLGALAIGLVLRLLYMVAESYGGMCVYASAFMEARAKEWNAVSVMQKLLPSLPGFLGVNLAVLAIVMLPTLSVLILSVLSPLFLLLGLITVPFGIYYAVLLSFSGAVYLIERNGVVAAIKRSKQLAEGKFWYVSGMLVGFSIIVGLISIAISLVLGAVVFIIAAALSSNPLELIADKQFRLITYLLAYPAAVFTSTVSMSFSLLIYMSLVSMKENSPKDAAMLRTAKELVS
jgi:hypothetical protein